MRLPRRWKSPSSNVNWLRWNTDCRVIKLGPLVGASLMPRSSAVRSSCLGLAFEHPFRGVVAHDEAAVVGPTPGMPRSRPFGAGDRPEQAGCGRFPRWPPSSGRPEVSGRAKSFEVGVDEKMDEPLEVEGRRHPRRRGPSTRPRRGRRAQPSARATRRRARAPPSRVRRGRRPHDEVADAAILAAAIT